MTTPTPADTLARIAAARDADARAAIKADVHAAYLDNIRAQQGGQIQLTLGPFVVLVDGYTARRNRRGNVVGVELRTRIYRGGVEQRIDGHRRFLNPPLRVPDGTFSPPIDPASGRTYQTPNMRFAPLDALGTILLDSIIDLPYPEGYRRGAATVDTFFGDTADGNGFSNQAAYADARAMTSPTINSTNTTAAMGQWVPGNYIVYQSFFQWDTSSIDDAASVSSVALSLNGSTDSSTTDFTLQARLHDWGATLDTGDVVAGASLSGKTLLATRSSSGWTIGGYNAFTEDAAFKNNINLSGSTRIIVVSQEQTDDSAPTNDEFVTCFTADQAGTSQDPKLAVTYTVDDSPGIMAALQPRHWMFPRRKTDVVAYARRLGPPLLVPQEVL